MCRKGVNIILLGEVIRQITHRRQTVIIIPLCKEIQYMLVQNTK